MNRVEDMPGAVRRAVQTALTPPTGPVFLALPLDVQMAQADGLDLSPPYLPDRRVRPPTEPLHRAADLLASARNPVILSGSRVPEAGATAELAAVADVLGAPVLAESATTHGRLPMPTDHPLYQGALPLWSPAVRERLAPFDVALAVGINLPRLYIYQEPARAIPEHLRIVHLDCDPWQVGKNVPVAVGLVGDPHAGLEELHGLLVSRLSPERRAAAAVRVEESGKRRAAEQDRLRAEIDGMRDARPMPPQVLMAALARVLPPPVAVVEEAPTTHHNLFERLGALPDPAGYFAHRGWALGWGIGCALGVKLAWPRRPVLALVGDGSAVYGAQGLWSAAHHRIPAVFVVCNNARYRILEVCGDVLGLKRIGQGGAPGMAVTHPEVDFLALARSFGVEAHRVTEPDELTERVRAALSGTGPVLFDVPLAG